MSKCISCGQNTVMENDNYQPQHLAPSYCIQALIDLNNELTRQLEAERMPDDILNSLVSDMTFLIDDRKKMNLGTWPMKDSLDWLTARVEARAK